MAISNDNFVNLIGHLGNAPVAKTLPSGLLVVEFSIATNNRYTDRDGNKVTSTDWHRIKAFGKVAELLDRFLKKGSKVAILGSLRQNRWVDKFDQNRTSTEVFVESFNLLDSRRQEDSDQENEYVDAPPRRSNDRPSPPRRQSTNQKVALADEQAMPSAKEKLPF